jgi:hypothetical protein
MLNVPAQLQTFVDKSKASQTFWGLQDPTSDDWVVCDSLEFEETDVMPLWTDSKGATNYCSEDWSDYVPVAITVEDFLEYWAADLNYDGVLLGLDWLAEDENSIEIDPIEVAKAFANHESMS